MVGVDLFGAGGGGGGGGLGPEEEGVFEQGVHFQVPRQPTL